MGNCLKTQLKESVNNGNLSYFNAVRIKVKANTVDSTECNLAFVSVPNGTEIKILNGASGIYLSNQNAGNNYGTEHTYNGESYVFLRGTNLGADWTELLIKTKEKFTGLLSSAYRYFNINLDEFAYCENLTSLDSRSLADNIIRGSVNSLATTNIQTLNLPPQYSDCTLNNLAKLTTLTNLAISYSNIKGVITDLLPLVNLTNLYVVGTQFITGDWKAFVEGKRVTSAAGQMVIRPGENTTFNGKAFNEWVNSQLIWDATSIIIKGDTNHKAYTYNITEAQRTALQNEGYTTIVAVD